jgi:hypothetical protein
MLHPEPCPVCLEPDGNSIICPHTISYLVTDQSSLAATSTRTVIVEAPSIVPPADASSTQVTRTE